MSSYRKTQRIGERMRLTEDVFERKKRKFNEALRQEKGGWKERKLIHLASSSRTTKAMKE